MKLFQNGLEISDTDAMILKEDMEDIETWIRAQISNKTQMAKEAFKNRWLAKLEQDEEVLFYPKKLNDMIQFIISRPYFRTRAEKMREEKVEKETQFQVE